MNRFEGTEPGTPTDLGNEPKEKTFGYNKEVSPQDLFKLSQRILLAVAVLFVLSAGAHISLPENKNAASVWDTAKVILYSIATLVLGYYFGKKDKQN